MNKCIMLGRLCRDVEIRSDGDKSVARFTIAVNRRFKNSDGNYEADFISCTAFGATADFVNKYFTKGSMVGIVGRWATGSYENKDGNKVYTNELIVEEVDFAGDKSSGSKDNSEERGADITDATDIDITNGEDLPF